MFALGDDIYPLQPDYEGVNYDSDMYTGKTREELHKMHKNIHRYEVDGKGFLTKFYCNIEMPNGHLNPLYGGDSPINSKL